MSSCHNLHKYKLNMYKFVFWFEVKEGGGAELVTGTVAVLIHQQILENKLHQRLKEAFHQKKGTNVGLALSQL